MTKYRNLFQEGHKFGCWKLLDPEPVKIPAKGKGKNNHTYKYKCRCSCGTEQEVDCYNLEKGISQRCYSCSMKNRTGENNTAWTGYKEIPGRFFYRLKKGAKNRQIVFDITIENVYESFVEAGGVCALTGVPISIDEGTASIDRVVSSKGYTKENIQWVHKDVNIMKNKFDQQYFVSMCKKVAEHHA